MPREAFFSEHWAATIKRCENSKSWEPDDLEQIRNLRSWVDAQKYVFSEDGKESVPSQIALIRQAMGHLSAFTTFFETKLGPRLDPSFIWGAAGLF